MWTAKWFKQNFASNCSEKLSYSYNKNIIKIPIPKFPQIFWQQLTLTHTCTDSTDFQCSQERETNGNKFKTLKKMTKIRLKCNYLFLHLTDTFSLLVTEELNKLPAIWWILTTLNSSKILLHSWWCPKVEIEAVIALKHKYVTFERGIIYFAVLKTKKKKTLLKFIGKNSFDHFLCVEIWLKINN